MSDPRAIACPYADCRSGAGEPCRNNQGDIVRPHSERVAASAGRTRLQVLEDSVKALTNRLNALEGALGRKGLP